MKKYATLAAARRATSAEGGIWAKWPAGRGFSHPADWEMEGWATARHGELPFPEWRLHERHDCA